MNRVRQQRLYGGVVVKIGMFVLPHVELRETLWPENRGVLNFVIHHLKRVKIDRSAKSGFGPQ